MPRWMKWWLYLFFLWWWTMGCFNPTAPVGAERYDPPAVYHTWWLETAECAHRVPAIAYHDIRWYVVPSEEWQGFDCVLGEDGCAGLAHMHDHEIYVAAWFQMDERIVKHEMLHLLLPEPNHPPIFQTCADTLRIL